MARALHPTAASAEMNRKFVLFGEECEWRGVKRYRVWKVVKKGDLVNYNPDFFPDDGLPLLLHQRLERFNVTIRVDGVETVFPNMRMFGRIPSLPRKYPRVFQSISRLNFSEISVWFSSVSPPFSRLTPDCLSPDASCCDWYLAVAKGPALQHDILTTRAYRFEVDAYRRVCEDWPDPLYRDRKSTRLNSSHQR